MAIVVCGGIKGGGGKTTLATNLAVMRSKGREVLLIDADDQETSADFTDLRNEKTNGEAGYTAVKVTGPGLRNAVAKLATKYDDILIDVGGRDTQSQRAALAVADLLVVPFVPRSFDIWTIDKVIEMVGDMRQANPKLRVSVFLNRADSRGVENDETREILRDKIGGEMALLEAQIGTRKAFGNAAAEGLSVTELKPLDPKAVAEMIAVYEAVFGADDDEVGFHRQQLLERYRSDSTMKAGSNQDAS